MGSYYWFVKYFCSIRASNACAHM